MTKISGETILLLILDRDNSASHLHANSLISENSIGSRVSSPNIVAYNIFPAQLQNFGDISLPKRSKSVGAQLYLDWVIKKILRLFGTNAILFYMN